MSDSPTGPPSPPTSGDVKAGTSRDEEQFLGILQLFSEWSVWLARRQHAHRVAALGYQRRYYLLGLPVVVLSGLVGTTVFASLERDVHLYAKLAVVAVSLLNAVLAAAHTFLRFGERAAKNSLLAADCAGLNRQISVARLLLPNLAPEGREKIVKEILDQLNQIHRAVAETDPGVDEIPEAKTRPATPAPNFAWP